MINQNNNRQQNGRRRGRGGGGQGPRPQGNPGRPDGGGNRIDSRARGNAQQLHEKYKNLARDSQMAGDRVTTEYYLQFADHYFRVLSESRARFEEQRPQQQRQAGDDDYDGDEGDEFQSHDNSHAQQPQQRIQRDDRSNYRRDDEQRRERQPDPVQAQAQPQPQSHGVTTDRQPDFDEAPRAVVEEGQRRTRRPRRPVEESETPQAIEADRLPPAISADNDAGSDAEEAPTPRRRGRPPRVKVVSEVPPAA